MSNRAKAEELLAKIVHRIDSNDNGTGFDRDDQFFLDKQLRTAQIMATLAVADAIENAKPITTCEVYGAMKRAEKEASRE